MLLALIDFFFLVFLKKKQDVKYNFTVPIEIRIIWYMPKHLDIMFLLNLFKSFFVLEF